MRGLNGLEAEVNLLRDSEGIVTIQAQNDLDAYRALGFVHAQERLWQMDFMRRTGAGRLSEVAGAATLGIDRFMRLMGFYRAAEASLHLLDPEVRDVVEAYSAGVNAFLESRDGALPLEFQLLGYAPEPWQPADSLVWGKLMALQLSGNWHDELRREALTKILTPKQLEALWPGYPADAPITLGARQSYLEPSQIKKLTELLPWSLAPKDASNAWVLSGKHTKTGKPILANDPHLELAAPGIWFLVRMETPDLSLSGATAPGVPFLVLGHNSHIAWGFTTTHSDTQDLFIEKLVPGDDSRYVTPEGTRPFDTRRETIKIKDANNESLTVRHSRHGPILSDIVESAEEAVPPDHVLALAWPALREDDLTAQALYRINQATDWKGFQAALRDFHAPQQNVVYADRLGNIGFMAPARVPIRKAGGGLVPVPGWTGDYDWDGFIPFEELPQSYNPPSGRIVTANNKLVPDDYPYLIAQNWPAPYRARRIEQLLHGNSAQDIENSAALQQDNLSLAAQELLPLMLKQLPKEDVPDHVIDTLQAWDYRMGARRARAA